MSDQHAHHESFSEHPMHAGHGHRDHAASAPFTDAEIEHFHKEDLAAGTAVVCLMVGIFSIGVVLYTIVAWACKQ